MIWAALAVIVIFWIIDLWKDAAWKRSKRCQHGIFGDCPKCQEEAEEHSRAAAVVWAEARRLQELDEAFFAIDEATRMKIIEVLEDHWVDADLLDWTAEQMKQTVMKVFQKSLANEGKPLEISGASMRRGKHQPGAPGDCRNP
ncbi:MAG TPA: hypothetical protein VHX20_14440 [Terracidiphilus sp.]|jgi:hypothetical protein|nr:hypothetical protein [Terracidiphilus sp.]